MIPLRRGETVVLVQRYRNYTHLLRSTTVPDAMVILPQTRNFDVQGACRIL